MAKGKSVRKTVYNKPVTTKRLDILLLALVLSVLILAAVTMSKGSVSTVTPTYNYKVKIAASPTAKPVVKTVKPTTVKVTK